MSASSIRLCSQHCTGLPFLGLSKFTVQDPHLLPDLHLGLGAGVGTDAFRWQSPVQQTLFRCLLWARYQRRL